MEFDDHLPLAKYLDNQDIQQQFNNEAQQSSFLLGKFAFREGNGVENMEEYILTAIKELLPLYQQLL